MTKSNFPIKRIEQITKLEENVKSMNEKLDSLSFKFDEFVKAADKKYASNDRVDALTAQINQNKTDIQKVTDWLAKWSTPIAVACYFTFKSLGLI